jgi:hypothetical protein
MAGEEKSYNEQVQPVDPNARNCPLEARSDGIRYQKAIERGISSSSLNPWAYQADGSNQLIL